MEDSKNDADSLAKPKVAIIGAGPSGLLSARHVKDVADVTVYESKDGLGGLWKYSEYSERNHPDPKSDAFYNLYGCLHPSMYNDLCTNLPKYLMTYKDFPLPEDTPYLLPHALFLKYLENYSTHFGICDLIKFNRTVTSLKVDLNGPKRYKITHVDTDATQDSGEQSEHFDYVLVCNGHFAKTMTPNFEGMDTFTGNQFHIHNLREFEDDDFEGKNVLIVGAYFSANDIIHHLFFDENVKERVHPKKVYMTSKNTTFLENSTLYQDLYKEGSLEIRSGNIAKIDQDTVHFGDGSSAQIDTIIYTTGYLYSVPFIDPKDDIITFEECCDARQQDPDIECGCRNGKYFGPLYKKLFSINEPNILFIGLMERYVVIQSTMERQAMVARDYIAGKIELPSKDDMMSDLEKELKNNEDINFPKSCFFKNNMKGYSFMNYIQDLAELIKMPVDTDNYKPMIEKYFVELRKLVEKNDMCAIKTVPFEKIFKDLKFNPTSDKF